MEIKRFMNSNQLLNLLIKNIILKTYNSAKNEMSSIIFQTDVSSKKNNRLLENFRNKVKQREYFLHYVIRPTWLHFKPENFVLANKIRYPADLWHI